MASVCLSLAGARGALAAPRGKPCPAFLPDGPPSSTPWCAPQSGPRGTQTHPSRGTERAGALDRHGRGEIGPLAKHEGPDVLLGITWEDSVLVTFDAQAGEVTQRHAFLNPDVAYTAVVYDRNHRMLYALPQDQRDLYIINATTLQTIDKVSLRVDTRDAALTDTVTLAYDAVTDTLYTVIGHWTNYPDGPIWSQLATIDRLTGAVTIVGRIDGPWITSLSFSETDRRLYATGVFGAGAWNSPYPTHVIHVDPRTVQSETIFVTPYHTMLGFAVREPLDFYSWINWDTRFYAQTHLPTQTITPMGPADDVDVIYAMNYRNFALPQHSVPIPPDSASFRFDGHVASVHDPEGHLAGRIQEGDRFAGSFSYDAAAPFKWADPSHRAPYGLSISINGVRYDSTALTATISNNHFDGYHQSVTDAFTLEAALEPRANLSWTLIDSEGQAVSTGRKLPRSFDLSAWDENRFSVVGVDEELGSVLYVVSGVVDHVARGKTGPVQGQPRSRSQASR